MSATMAKPPKPESRNTDRHIQPRLAFHMPQDLFDAFKHHVETSEPRPAEAAVLRLALQQYLERAGEWPPPTVK